MQKRVLPSFFCTPPVMPILCLHFHEQILHFLSLTEWYFSDWMADRLCITRVDGVLDFLVRPSSPSCANIYLQLKHQLSKLLLVVLLQVSCSSSILTAVVLTQTPLESSLLQYSHLPLWWWVQWDKLLNCYYLGALKHGGCIWAAAWLAQSWWQN